MAIEPKTTAALDRITIAAGGFAPIGGVETLVHSLALSLRSRNINVEVICWGAESPLLADMKTLGVRVRRTPFQWGCRWGLPDTLMFAHRRRDLRNARLIVFPKLLRPEFHIAHRRMNRANSRTVLITPYRPAEMWATAAPSPELLDCFDTIVTQSPVFEADLREFGYKGVIAQLPYIPPVCEPIAPSPAGPVRIGFLGRLVEDKRVDYLIEAVSCLPEFLDFRLEIFGDGPLKTSLEQRTAKLGLEPKVTFHGAVERNRIKAAIDFCTLFAFSSRTEGQCLAAMEILARGRPLVTTPVGLFPELFANCRLGWLAPADDPARFGEVLIKVASEVAGNPAFTPQAVQDVYARRFGSSVVIEGYVKLFQCMFSGEK